MKIAIMAFALISASLALAPAARAMDCYWDHAQHAKVCKPNHMEREEWRARRDYEGWQRWGHHYSAPEFYDRGYYRPPMHSR